MGINIQSKGDYSYLFSGLSSSGTGSSANLNFLSDYASIKNGSYGKLMKAYYGKNANDSVSSLVNSKSKDTSKVLAEVQSSTDALKESADALLTTGKDSLFTKKDITTTDANGNKTTTNGYDTDAIYKALSKFVDDYNSVLKATDNINTTGILNKTLNMVKATATNSKLLTSIGINIKSDNSLSIDKETFMKADMTTVKSLFNGNSSYAYRVSAQSSLINFAADNEAAKANTYGASGTYSNNYSSGNIYNSFF